MLVLKSYIILCYAYIYKCKNTHSFSKSINYHEENLILEYFSYLSARKNLKKHPEGRSLK